MIVGNEREFIKESICSFKDFADEIVIVLDDKSNDGTEKIIKSMKLKNLKLIKHKWEMAKSKQFAYEQTTKDWVLFLDGDEVLSDNASELKKYIELAIKDDVKVIDIRSHHLMYNFLWEDSFEEIHYHKGRLFENDKNRFKITGKNHAVLTCDENKKIPVEKYRKIDKIRIFHFGYVKHLQKILDKYERDMKIKQLHTTEFLNNWLYAHLFGTYPIKTFFPVDLPKILLEKFHLKKVKENANN